MTRVAPARQVARQFQLPASTVRAIDLRCLERWSAARKMPPMAQMGVDEIYLGKKQKFITVVSNLDNPRVLQGGLASFRALVDGNGPYTYQWFKNGSPIAGAGNWKYMTPPLLLSDNGAQYSVTVTGTNSSVSSTGTVTRPVYLALASR